MELIEYSCPKCGRSARSPRARALELAANKRGCQFCGGALVFPPGVLAGANATSGETVSYTCGCDRTHTRPLAEVVAAIASGKTTCRVCREEYDFPAAARAAAKSAVVIPEVRAAATRSAAALEGAAGRTHAATARKRETECPACLRPIRADPRDAEAVLTCGFCGARLRAPLEGRGFRPPPLEGDPASPDEVRRALATMPRGELPDVARVALLARAARGEVSRDEARSTAEWHASLARWRPEEKDVPYVPLAPSVAAHALPPTVFAGLGRAPGSAKELVFLVGHETGITTKGVLNVIGIAALVTTGAGFLVLGGSQGNTRRKAVRLRVSLVSTPGGVTLELARQVDDDPEERLSAREHGALRERIASVAPAIRHYFTVLAVFGPWARGTPTASASVRAIESRLTSLGEPLASRAGPLARQLRSGLDTVRG